MPPDPRYPIGRFQYAGPGTPEQRSAWIADIAAAPGRLRAAVQGLSDAQLDTPYRDGGWTVRQVAHHVPDSHLNAYVRFKLALTEDEPVIRPYDEKRWAELPDGRTGSLAPSLDILDALHERWVRLLRSLGPAEFARRLNHPESGIQDLDRLTAHYAWHGKHHVAHVMELRNRLDW
jgi:uncharacterized damage-inducible protein DinB